MTKSNLNLHNAIKVLEKWQAQEDSNKLVYVVDFCIRPQSKSGVFMLSLDLYIVGISENSIDGKTSYFYGSIVECINQAVDKVEEIKEDLRNRI